MNLPRATTKFYAQEYQDLPFNTKLDKVGHILAKSSINLNFESFDVQNDLFSTIFGQNQANLRMARTQNFNFNYTNYISSKEFVRKKMRKTSILGISGLLSKCGERGVI